MELKEVLLDIVVSPIADELLTNDMLTEEFEIVVESLGRGVWGFRK
ncbi:MAG: hypothetical protein ACUVQ8_06060 [Nitrososphaeria archaeon]